ncbi:hypothetical protein [uncultured Helicobacter sp.]|uniref:hypothetical protein n=1 Tax=uncultured Helicobacter sp. TaxID=175537 RepID=UPI00262E31E3|nr:hypothetical protein [uncultured Helicobacter sp.]
MKNLLGLTLIFFATAILATTWYGFYLYAINGFNAFVMLAIIATSANFIAFLANLKVLR